MGLGAHSATVEAAATFERCDVGLESLAGRPCVECKGILDMESRGSYHDGNSI